MRSFTPCCGPSIRRPSYDDFVTWLDEPTYEPSDRLLVKHGNQIVAHLQVLHRTAWFDDVRLPVGSAQDLAVLPEYSHAGYDRQLIAAAEHAMRDSQAIVSLVRTSQPEPFRAAGWIDVRAGGYSQVSVSDILAHLSRRDAVTAAPRRGHCEFAAGGTSNWMPPAPSTPRPPQTSGERSIAPSRIGNGSSAARRTAT